MSIASYLQNNRAAELKRLSLLLAARNNTATANPTVNPQAFKPPVSQPIPSTGGYIGANPPVVPTNVTPQQPTTINTGTVMGGRPIALPPQNPPQYTVNTGTAFGRQPNQILRGMTTGQPRSK